MKKILLTLLLPAAALFAQTKEAPQRSAIDGYAARVDSDIITYGDIRQSVMPYVQQLMKTYQGEDLVKRIEAAYLDGREALIEEALFKEEAKALKLSLPDKVIDSEVDRLVRERFDNDRALLTRALAARRMTFEEWRQEVADQFTVRVFYNQEVTRRANVSTQAVRDEYDRTRADYFIPFRVKYRIILINRGQTEEEQAIKRKLAEDTLQKLREGADFETLAEEVSEGDPAVSPWRDPADVREELRPALRETSAGQISDLIEAGSVFYIIKVEERREEGYIPFEEVRESIHKHLLEIEQNRLHKELVERLSKKHFIERY